MKKTNPLFNSLKGITPLVVLFVLMLISGQGWGQQVIGSLPNTDGGFEGQTNGTITTLSSIATGVQRSDWTVSAGAGAATITSTGGRSGPKYLTVEATSATARRYQSPTAATTALASSTAYTIQYYYKTASTTAFSNGTVGLSNDGTSSVGTYVASSMNGTSGIWTKVQVSATSGSSTATPRYGISIFRITNASAVSADIDDFVIYAGAVDNTAANSPGSVTVGNTTTSTLDVSWGAASGGVDGGGYVVVRYTSNPNADNDPNQNGIYAVGNTTTNGTGSLTGTVRYIGTGLTFTDNVGLSVGTQYWYKVYTVDKAFNYSGETSGNGTTTSLTPTITAPSPSSLTGFSTNFGTASTAQTFTIGGSNLTANLTVTPPIDYEVSVGAGTYTSTLSLATVSGTVSSTVNVRIASTAAVGSPSGNVVCASAGAATQTVTLTGTVLSASSPSLSITGTASHGSVCPNTAASSIQYTITNSGPVQADGITVTSNNSEFVVSGLTSTTIAATNGTVTYTVIFTPLSSGAKTATITVATTTGGSNTPTISLSGTGTASVTQTVSSSAATSVTAQSAILNGNFTTLGVCPATTEKGFVYATSNTNPNPLVGGTGVTKSTVTLGSTGTYSLTLTTLPSSTAYSYKAYVYNGTDYAYGLVMTLTTSVALAISGTLNNGTVCPNIAAAPLTYTVTNNGAVTIDGVSAASSDAQFVVSSMSSSSIVASGTATYTVTFTPSSAGSKSATVTVSSTTSDIQSVSNIPTGTGTTPVTQSVTSSSATAVTAKSATLNGNFTTLGVCPATTEKGFVYSLSSDNINPLVGGTGVTKSTVTLGSTGTYSLTLTTLPSSTAYSYKAYVYNGTDYAYGSVMTLTTSVALAISGTTAHGSICPSVAAPSQTYTITNSGAVSVDGIAVVSGGSDAANFVVSGLSSTTIAAGGTATYAVTFTPSSSGSKTATITVSSTTAGIVSVSNSLSGSGIAIVPAVVSSTAATLVTANSASLNGNLVTLSICPAIIEKGFVYSVSGTNSDPLAGGSGVTKTSVASLITGAYTLALSSLPNGTAYSYKAYVYDGANYTYGLLTSFLTIPAAPTATAATSLTSSGFTANWGAVSGAESYRLDLSTSASFGTGINATDLFISEYVEGTSNNKAIEIYNGTGSSVNLSSYSLKKQANGSGAFGSELILSGTLVNNATYVIVNSSSGASLLALATITSTSSVLTFNGNDAVALYKSGNQIDVVGVVDQAANWGIDMTLVRNISVVSPTVSYNQTTDWTQYATDDFSHLGAHAYNIPTPSFVFGYNDLTVGSTSTQVTTLTPNTNYYYRVRAYSPSSTSPNSNVITAVTAPLAPTVGLITQPSCFVSTGSVVLSGLPATGTWTVNPGTISGTGTSTTLTGLTASSTYNFTVSNAAGSTSLPSADVVIQSQKITPTAAVLVTITQPSCYVATASVELSGLPSGNWILNPGTLSGSTTTTTLIAVSPGTHTYTVTNADGCTSLASDNIVVNAQPVTPTVSSASVSPASVCVSGSVSFTATPSSGSIEWYDAASGGSIVVSPPTTISSTTTLYAEATANGCVSLSRSTVTATVYDLPAPVITGDATVCAGTTSSVYSVTEVAGHTYSWTVTGGSITSGGTTNSITVDWGVAAAATVDVIEGIATLSCTTSATQKAVTITALPTASISYAGSPYCLTLSAPQSVSLIGSGAYTGGSFSAVSGLSLDAVNGSFTPSTSTAATYTITYTIAATGGCTAVTATTSVQITACYTLTISKSGADGVGGRITSSPAGIDCGSSCSYLFPAGTTVVLTSTPIASATFSGWSGAASGTSSTASIVMTTDKSVGARFTYSLTVSKTGSGSGTVTSTPSGISCGATCAANYDAGSLVSLSASAAPGSVFSGWSGAATGTSTSNAISMESNQTAYAEFTCLLPATPGTISGTATVCSGTSQTYSIEAVPNTTSYTWSLPSGWIGSSSNNSITATAGLNGNISVVANNACGSGTAQTLSVTVTQLPTAAISYTASPWCTSASAQIVSLTASESGSFTASPSGLTIDAVNGTITPSTTTAGTYTVTYTIAAAGACSAVTASDIVTITALPTASISYSASPWCTTALAQTVTVTGTTGGTYTSTSGLSLNTSTGEITPASSLAGTYTVTYTIAAAAGCDAVISTANVHITAAPIATIAYTGTPYCTSIATEQAVTHTGTTGGAYTATPGGLIIDASTGAITPSTSSATTYTVTYTIAASGGCVTLTATTNVTITTLPTATISYSGSPWCASSGSPSIALPGTSGGSYGPSYYPGGTKIVSFTGTHGGEFTATPGGLSINASSGAITPASSAGGTYTVTYTLAAAGGCATVTATTNVTITTLPTAAISYSGSPFCTSASAQSVSFSGTSGGTYTSTSGLSLNTSAGEITPTSSTAGTYTVTYTIAAAGGCAAVNAMAGLSITALPTASISYSGSPMCTSASAQTVSFTGTVGGTFTSTSGLSINTSTGEITPATSTAGTYTVTYTIAAAGGCEAVIASTSVTITTLPTAAISYSGSPYCTSASAQSVSFSGTSGGTYTSTSGLSLDTSTGEITPASSSAGTYTVTYTIAAAGGCAAVNATAGLIINTLPTATISYSGSPMCTSASAQTVSFTGTTGGTYTSTSGLSINTSTGEITPASSTAGTYTVTYTIAASGGCSAVTASVSVSVIDLPSQPSVSVIQPSCVTSTATVSVTSSLTGLHFSKNAVDYSNTTGVFSGLSAASTYSITARNDYGCVSPAATGSINIQPLTPPAPTANAASSISSTGFTANWSTVSPPGWAAGSGVSYFMDVSTSNTFTSFVTGYNNLAIASGITKLVSGLTANTTYYYRIRSQYYSLCASVNSNVITVTTLGPPTLTTIAISSVLTVSASSGGNITADGGSAVTAKGVCWSTSPAPTTASSTLTTDGSGTAGFTSNITGLIALTTYYVRAYATNGIGTAYGNEVSFMTASGSGTIVTNLANSGAGSLRDAIANVAEGGIITFADGLNGTITLATSLVINLNIFFDNHNLAIGTILGGSGACITINAGKTLTIKTGSKLTVTGGVLNNGGKGIAGLVIASGASFIHNTVDLQATVKRELNPAWHLFGSPFKQNTGSSLAALIPSGGNVQMMPYTNGVNWGSVVSSPYYYFKPTSGYAVKPSATVTASLSGMLYYSPVDYTIPLIYNGTAATQSWNLVANPYTSYLNFNLLGKTNLNTSLYLWDNSLYPLYTPVTNAAYFRTYNSCNNVGVPAGTTPFIAPLQGFFVRGVYTAPKLSFIPSARVHSASPYFKEQSNTEILVRLKTESEQGMDELVICKNPAAKLDFEQFDSEKLFGGLPIEFYSQSASGEKLVINSINSTETIIPLGINGSAGAKGRITAFALESGEQLYLEDRLKAKIISLTENTSYDFEFPGDQIVGRFFIRFGAVNSSLTTSDVKVFVNENQLNVMAQTGEEIQAVEVFTVTGARVFKAEVGKTNVFTTDLQLSSAMYLVRVKTSLTTQNVKIRL